MREVGEMSENNIPIYGKPLQLSKLKIDTYRGTLHVFENDVMIISLQTGTPFTDIVIFNCRVCYQTSIVERWRENVVFDCNMNEIEPTTQRICRKCWERIIQE